MWYITLLNLTGIHDDIPPRLLTFYIHTVYIVNKSSISAMHMVASDSDKIWKYCNSDPFICAYCDPLWEAFLDILNPSHSVPTLSYYFVDMYGWPTINLNCKNFPSSKVWSSWVCRVFHISSPNQSLTHTYMPNHSSGNRDCTGTLMSTILIQGLYDLSSPFSLLKTLVVRRGVYTYSRTWNIPYHIV